MLSDPSTLFELSFGNYCGLDMIKQFGGSVGREWCLGGCGTIGNRPTYS